MRRLLPYLLVSTALFAGACSESATKTKHQGPVYFAHQASDLSADADIEYGRLPNGLRYAVRSNATPSKTATLLMRVDTGSLNEVDGTQGLAHFLEHMAFNGSENIPENEMIKRLERFGLAFGPDTNASTSFDETIYQLELPEVTEDVVNETLMIMRETADRLTLAPDAIDRERGVIQSERRARTSSPSFKAFIDSINFYLEGSRIPERLPIGTEATIDSVPAKAFRDFYEGYYRPENTFITFVGDFETSYAIEKIEEYFGDWAAEGEALEPLPVGEVSLDVPRSHIYVNPEVQTSASVSTLSVPEIVKDTSEARQKGFVDTLGFSILNRRLGKEARTEDAKFISASVSSYQMFEATEVSTLSVNTQPETWAEGLGQAEKLLRQALEFGFTQAELDEQLANAQKGLEVAVQTSPTRRTPRLARGILGAFSSDTVVTSPQDNLDVFLETKSGITLEKIEAAFQEQWGKLDKAPQLELTTSQEVEGGEQALEAVYAQSRAIAAVPRAAEEKLEFAYSDFGAPGKVVKKDVIEDIDMTTVVFENNVRLNIKKTPYETDVIRIRAALGNGTLTFDKTKPGLRIFAPNITSLSGLKAHSIDDIRTIMAGKSVGASVSLGSERVVVSGSTVPEDLDDQLNLMTAYAIAPGYRKEAQAQYEKYIKSFYPTLDSTPGGVSSRDVPRLLRSGDTRFGFPTEAELINLTLDDVKNWREENIDAASIEVGVVGDVDIDATIKAVARTFGALPKRAAKPVKADDAVVTLKFPRATRVPVKLTHAGDAQTALLQIYWPAPDGRDVMTSRRLSMISSLFRLRLTEEVRENAGESYSPSAFSYATRLWKDYGYIGASLEVSPDKIDLMSELVEKIAAEFARGEMDDALFERGIKPALERIETSLESNGYWMNLIGSAQFDPERLDRHRSRDEAYQNMTVEDLKPLAAQVFNPKAVYKVHILPEK